MNCILGHDGPIIHYHERGCTCKCTRCGAYYKVYPKSDIEVKAIYVLIIVSLIIMLLTYIFA